MRDFNNVRTAIRNGDLAIRDLHPQLLLRAWVDSGPCMAATTAGFLGPKIGPKLKRTGRD